VSTYQRQFGHNNSILYFCATFINSFSNSIFQISLNQAEITITLLTPFFQDSINESKTNLAGIAQTKTSGTIGSSLIDLINFIHSNSQPLGFTQYFSHSKEDRFFIKLFPIFHVSDDAQTIATEFMLKKLFMIKYFIKKFCCELFFLIHPKFLPLKKGRRLHFLNYCNLPPFSKEEIQWWIINNKQLFFF